MPSKPLFSIILPTFNRADLLPFTLDSIKAQTYTDFELIIIDDGSSDCTQQVIESYQKDYPITYIWQNNQGQAKARNRGFQEAQGRYCAFLDSDDLWFPWTLETYASAIKEFGEVSGMLGEKIIFNDLNLDRVDTHQQMSCKFHNDLLAASNQKLWLGTPCSVIRSDVLENSGGFSSDSMSFEDLDLWLRIGTADGFLQILTPPVLAYRQHTSNITLDVKKASQGVNFIINNEYNNVYPGGKCRSNDRRALVTRLARSISVGLIQRGWTREGMNLYFRSWAMQWEQRRYLFLVGCPLKAIFRKMTGNPRVGAK